MNSLYHSCSEPPELGGSLICSCRGNKVEVSAGEYITRVSQDIGCKMSASWKKRGI